MMTRRRATESASSSSNGRTAYMGCSGSMDIVAFCTVVAIASMLPAVLIARLMPPGRNAKTRENDSTRRTDRRKKETFRQKLTDQPAAAGSQGGSYSNFAISRRCADHQQVRDVAARDQQNKSDRSQQHDERRPDVSDVILEQRPDEYREVEVLIRILRIVFDDLSRDPLHVLARTILVVRR